jgi:hypothetical protein
LPAIEHHLALGSACAGRELVETGHYGAHLGVDEAGGGKVVGSHGSGIRKTRRENTNSKSNLARLVSRQVIR